MTHPTTTAVTPMLLGVDPAIWLVLGLLAACAAMFALMRWTNDTLASTHEVNTDRRAAARLYLVLSDLADEHPRFVSQATGLREGRTAREWAVEVEALARGSALPADVLEDVLEECRDGLWSDRTLLDRRTAPPE